jgi:1,4-dihydroxy-2-naphthoyl-CoA hydrolase
MYRGAPMEADLPYHLDGGFDELYGLELTELSDELASGVVAVRDELKQPTGLVHGGVYAAVSEALASFGTAVGVVPDGDIPLGLSNQTSFLRPITEGTMHARAIRKHRGRTTWVWEVEISDDASRLCAISRVTIAVRRR